MISRPLHKRNYWFRKTIGLGFLFAFVFIPFLNAESSFDEESFFSEELFLDDLFLDEEPFFDEDLFSEEEYFIGEAPTLVIEVPTFILEPRSFDDIFPNLSHGQRALAMSSAGLKYSFTKDDSPTLIPDPDFGIDILSSVMDKNPSTIIEALLLVPYNERELDLLDVYNALGKIENIKDHTVPVNGRDITIFTETTRLESSRNRRPVPDPPPADTLPYIETMYLRFRDEYMGNLFLRGDTAISLYGITYSLTNFTDVRYFFIPIMRAERFSAIIYLEPVKEGILVYSMSGLYLPGFIADRINLTTNINRRITVLINWITDSLRKQERALREQGNGPG